MSRKGFVLYPFLLLFSAVVIMINEIAINEFRNHLEIEKARFIDTFSLIEIETIRLIKKQFSSFKPKDFVKTIGIWHIEVSFNDETALIKYTGSSIVEAYLVYDMVFENVMDYQIQSPTESNID